MPRCIVIALGLGLAFGQFAFSAPQSAPKTDMLGAQDPIPTSDTLANRQAKDTLRAEARAAMSQPEPTEPPAKKKPTPPVYRFTPPKPPQIACREAAEILVECTRGHLQVTGVPQGFPGTPAKLYGIGLFEAVGWHSPYQADRSGSSGQAPSGLLPHALGGLRLPDSVSFVGPSFALQALAETWTPKAPLDTPLTRLRWQRGALAFNQFQVDLDRALVGGSYVGLTYTSFSADSQLFDYTFNVTQPYLSGWGILGQLYSPIDRDSASLVLTGISPKVEANHFRPRLGLWLDTNQVVEVFYDRTRNRTNLGLPSGEGRLDSTFAPYAALSSTDAFGVLYGGALAGTPHLSHTLQFVHSAGQSERYAIDTSSAGAAANRNLDALTDRLIWEGVYRRQDLEVTLALRSESEILEGRLPALGSEPGQTAWRDQQALGMNLQSKQWLDVKAGLGLKRESRATDRVVFLPEVYGEADRALPWGFGLNLGALARRSDPDPMLLLRDEPTQNYLASPELDPRFEWGGQGRLRWQRGVFGLYGGAEAFWMQDPWAPAVMPNPSVCGQLAEGLYSGIADARCTDTATVSDTLAARWRNYASQERLQALIGLHAGLGNWRLWLENRYLIYDRLEDSDYLSAANDLTTTPARLFRGQILWTRRLISERMRLRLEWNWEWMSRRHAWAHHLNGTATSVKLDEYLMLDFYAGMRIKTFTLHFRAQNMNHDRYAPEPGVHPVGVNFRFGVDWSMFN